MIIDATYLNKMYDSEQVLRLATDPGSGAPNPEDVIAAHIEAAEANIVSRLQRKYSTEEIQNSALVKWLIAVMAVYTLAGRRMGTPSQEILSQYQNAIAILNELEEGSRVLESTTQYLPPKPDELRKIYTESGLFDGLEIVPEDEVL